MNAMPQMNEAETRYFESGGADIAPELEKGIVREKPTFDVDAEAGNAESAAPAAAPAAEAAAKAAPQVETDASGETIIKRDNKEERFVPLQALQEERAEKKQLRDELRQYREWQAQLTQRLQQQAPATQAPQAPDPQTQPLEYINHVLGNMQASTAELQQWRQQQTEAANQRTALQQQATWATGQEAEFRKTQPEYDDAYKFAAAARDKELQALGYTDPAARAAVVRMNTSEIINNAIQQGRNPAELVWEYAKARGFAPKGTKQPGLGADMAQGGDAQASAKIAAGLQAAGGKLNAGGDTGGGEMSAKDLAGINDPVEFEKAWKKVFGKKR